MSPAAVPRRVFSFRSAAMRRSRLKPNGTRPKRPSERLRLAASLLPELGADPPDEPSEEALAAAAAILARLDALT
jgi:hypothetical protein